ncbi:helix-turn-helix domain-containing protein [uncultured Corynebacterium sp.]|uniref:helix-turn-helix domain-containing protein n=1 Tax=uncultured Corynebacterium sp. TaxID=159447 RepID=UPI00288ACB15|nr:helix-turn-helix domain-containing protein [uncultured Corynebacterium sp.]
MDRNGLEDWPQWTSYGYCFASNLSQLRELRGLTQQELGDLAQLSRNQISNMERNETSKGSPNDPFMSTVYRLARALEVPPAVLFPQAMRNVDLICAPPTAMVLTIGEDKEGKEDKEDKEDSGAPADPRLPAENFAAEAETDTSDASPTTPQEA